MNVEHVEFSADGTNQLKGIKLVGVNTTQRNPTHTIILLDTSGSMNDNRKLENVKRSLNFLLRFFQSTDKLSLVTFNHTSTIVINNKIASAENLQIFEHTIERIVAEGGTNLSAGLLNVNQILQNSERTMKNGVILLTDGQVNEGITQPSELIRIIQTIKTFDPNISINSIGYGEDHNYELLKNSAIEGNGSYNIVNNIEEVGTVFGDVLGGLISCVAQNISVTYPIGWNTLNQYKNTQIDLNNRVMNIGDIYAESEIILLFENTSNDTVTIQGTSTSDFRIIQNIVNWNFNQSSVSFEPYIMAFIRLKLAKCLMLLSDPNMFDSIRTTLTNLSNVMQNPIIQNNSFLSYLRNEHESILNQINSNRINLNQSQNIQHSAFLGLARGTSSAAPRIRRIHREVLHYFQYNQRGNQNDDDDDDDIDVGVANMNITTPFANQAQRLISQALYQASQDPTSHPSNSSNSQNSST